MTPGQASPYRAHDAPAGPTGGRGGSSISLQTLIVASVASAVTSFTVSKLWGPGTLFSAAATPILVALISELVRRPVRQVGATAKVAVAPLRYRPPMSSDTLVAPSPPAPSLGPSTRAPRYPPPPTPQTETEWIGAGAPPASGERRAGPRWRLVLATGLLACMIVIGLFTALDVLAGQSITGSGDSTTYFSGRPAQTPTPKTDTPTTPTIGTTGTTGTTSPPPTQTVTVTTPAAAPASGTTAGASGATSGSTGATGATGATTPPTAQPTTP